MIDGTRSFGGPGQGTRYKNKKGSRKVQLAMVRPQKRGRKTIQHGRINILRKGNSKAKRKQTTLQPEKGNLRERKRGEECNKRNLEKRGKGKKGNNTCYHCARIRNRDHREEAADWDLLWRWSLSRSFLRGVGEAVNLAKSDGRNTWEATKRK